MSPHYQTHIMLAAMLFAAGGFATASRQVWLQHLPPDKVPSLRLDTIAAAGEEKVPFTSGILIGIGETRRERSVP